MLFRRALFSDVFTDTAKMPSPIWEVGRTKKEVVRFNHGGFICPAHNYEPWRCRMCLGRDVQRLAAAAALVSRFTSPSCLSGLYNHTKLFQFYRTETRLSRRLRGSRSIIAMTTVSPATPPAAMTESTDAIKAARPP